MAMFRDLLPNFGKSGIFWTLAVLREAIESESFLKEFDKAWDEDEETRERVIKRAVTSTFDPKQGEEVRAFVIDRITKMIGRKEKERLERQKDKDKENPS
jgi:hypothetical protein